MPKQSCRNVPIGFKFIKCPQKQLQVNVKVALCLYRSIKKKKVNMFVVFFYSVGRKKIIQICVAVWFVCPPTATFSTFTKYLRRAKQNFNSLCMKKSQTGYKS